VEIYFHSPNTPPWLGAQLKHRDNLTLTFTFTFAFTSSFRCYRRTVFELIIRSDEHRTAWIVTIGSRRFILEGGGGRQDPCRDEYQQADSGGGGRRAPERNSKWNSNIWNCWKRSSHNYTTVCTRILHPVLKFHALLESNYFLSAKLLCYMNMTSPRWAPYARKLGSPFYEDEWTTSLFQEWTANKDTWNWKRIYICMNDYHNFKG
jgi:hypothetical protein